MMEDLRDRVKQTARQAGADLVGIASIDRFDHAPPEVHPRSVFSHTQSEIAVGCRMVRGALKTAEEGLYWGAYNCDSYQYINEVLAPHLLRRIVLLLEDQGYTAVPIHNPFHPHTGRPVRPGATSPDGIISLRVIGCAAGLGELGMSKLFLTPQFGPRQRMFAVLTDAVLPADPLLTEPVCDECGGRLQSNVVNFGDPIPQKVLKDSYEHSAKADVFLVVGSSLTVTPAADMPLVSLQNGGKLIIINNQETPFDNFCAVRFNEDAGEVLTGMVSLIKKMNP